MPTGCRRDRPEHSLFLCAKGVKIPPRRGWRHWTRKFQKEGMKERESWGKRVSRGVSLSVLPLYGTGRQIVTTSPPPTLCWVLETLMALPKSTFYNSIIVESCCSGKPWQRLWRRQGWRELQLSPDPLSLHGSAKSCAYLSAQRGSGCCQSHLR